MRWLYGYQSTQGYSFDFSFTWIFIILVVLALAAIAVSIPYHVFRLAWQNRFRLNGTVSRRRLKKEARHLADFAGELVLVPLLVLALMGGALVLVHHYVIPIPLMADLAAMFSPDPVVMDARTETGDLGDVGRIYGEWSAQQGFSSERSYTWRKFLKQNVLMLAFLAGLFGLFCYWFVTRYYLAAVAAYRKGVLERRARYYRRDQAKRATKSQPEQLLLPPHLP